MKLFYAHFWGGARVEQWWEHLSPSNVARVQILVSMPHVGWLCCWFSPLSIPRGFSLDTQVFPSPYCQTQKTVNTWKISGMLIVYWPITIKFRTCEQTSKPQTNYRCCLWFSYLAPYWLISRNTITFHKYFWCSRFCEFHSKNLHFQNSNSIRNAEIHFSKFSWTPKCSEGKQITIIVIITKVFEPV